MLSARVRPNRLSYGQSCLYEFYLQVSGMIVFDFLVHSLDNKERSPDRTGEFGFLPGKLEFCCKLNQQSITAGVESTNNYHYCFLLLSRGAAQYVDMYKKEHRTNAFVKTWFTFEKNGYPLSPGTYLAVAIVTYDKGRTEVAKFPVGVVK